MSFEVEDDRYGHGFARTRDDGQPIELPGWSMRIKVAAADTQGQLTVLYGEMIPHLAGPPAHVHAAHDETFVVLAGRMQFRIGDLFHTALPGETIYAGRHLVHGFSNPHDEPARYVVILTPSGYEGYFLAVAEHVARTGTMPDPVATANLMAQHQTLLSDPLS